MLLINIISIYYYIIETVLLGPEIVVVTIKLQQKVRKVAEPI